MDVTRYLQPLLLFTVLFLNACSVPSQVDYTALAVEDREYLNDWSGQDEGQAVTHLTQLIDSKEVNELVDEALAANPNLQQTLLTLKMLQAQYRQTAANRLPEASFDTSATQEEGGQESYSGSITISWEVDMWQKLADSERAAAMDEAEQQRISQAARDALAAQVMKEWLGLIADQHAIDIEQQRLHILEQNEGYILQRYRNGIGSLEDLDSGRSSTALSRASVEEYKENLVQRQRNMQTLLGRTATTPIVAAQTYPHVVTPLAELPDQTLGRRPDLQAAFFAIEAADFRTSVAYKDLLPTISLKAALEDIADSPTSMLLRDPVWTLLGQLTAPLFQGGKLKAAAAIAELETAKSYQAYREVLLDAINEVESALSLAQSYSRRQHHIESALVSGRNSLTRYQESYRSGLVDILDLLSVQEKTFDTTAQLDNIIYQRLINRIDLGLALGLGVTK